MRLVLRPVGAYLSRFYTDEKKKKKKPDFDFGYECVRRDDGRITLT